MKLDLLSQILLLYTFIAMLVAVVMFLTQRGPPNQILLYDLYNQPWFNFSKIVSVRFCCREKNMNLFSDFFHIFTRSANKSVWHCSMS